MEGVSLSVLASAFSSSRLVADTRGGAHAILKEGAWAAFEKISILHRSINHKDGGRIFTERICQFLPEFQTGFFTLPIEYRTSFNISTPRNVSVLSPIGRFIPRMVVAACNAGTSFNLYQLVDWASPQDHYKAICFMVEYALRALSMSAQMDCQMWRRNGLGVANLLYNYNRPPLCRHFRDLDLTAVQLAIAWLGPDVVIENMLLHFECNPAELVGSRTSSIFTRTTRGMLLSEFLKAAIQIVTYLPVSLTKDVEGTESCSESKDDYVQQTSSSGIAPCEGLSLALDRLVAHKMLGGSNTVTDLAQLKPLLGNGTLIGDDSIDDSVQRLCAVRPQMVNSKSSEATLFVFKPESCIPLFDPECPLLSTQELQTAVENVKSSLQRSDVLASMKSLCPSTSDSAVPILYPTAVPTPHHEMAIVRRLLYSPALLSALIDALTLCADGELVEITGSDGNSSAKVSKAVAISIATRCVHLCTLQLHCLEYCKINDVSQYTHHSDYGDAYLNHLWQGVDTFLTTECDQWRGLLKSLVNLHSSQLLAHDVCYGRGLEWVLLECGRISPPAKEYLISCGYNAYADERRTGVSAIGQKESGSSDGDADAERKRKLEARKLAAKKRAMDAMAKKASAFGTMLEEMEEEAEESVDQKDTPECIICR